MTGIPDVPPVSNPALREFLLALRNQAVSTAERVSSALDAEDAVLDTTDTNPPAAPAALDAVCTSGTVSITWVNPGDDDLASVEVWENTVDVQPDPLTDLAMRITTVPAKPDEVGMFARAGLATGDERYYWVRSIDLAGNISAFNDTAGTYVFVTSGGGDTTIPGTVSNLTALGGFTNVWLTWTSPSDVDIAGTAVYENNINDSSTATRVALVPALPISDNSYMRGGLLNNVTRYYWVKVVDESGNVGLFSNVASATTSTIDPGDLGTAVAFGAPSGLGVTSNITTDTDGTQVVTVNVDFNVIADTRLSFYEVAISEASGTFVVFTTATNHYSLVAKGNVAYDVKVRGVDRNGNRTSYSSTVSHTSTSNTTTPTAPTSPSASAGIGSIYLAWTNPTNTTISKTQVFESPDNVTFTLVATVNAASAQPGKFARTGLATNLLRYYYFKTVDTSGNVSVASSTVSATTAKVLSGDITVDSVLANSVVTNVTTTNVLNANVIQSTSTIPSTLVIGSTGFTLGAISDPATALNANTTLVSPGKIQLTGATTLSSWQNGTDLTKIEGGSIAANTITANSVTIGVRGVSITSLVFEHNSPGSNQVSWTAGTINYGAASGTGTTVSVSSGSASWSSGVVYVYWVKDATSLASTTNANTAYQSDRIVLATYAGGVALNANYGGTIIDGSNIKTGTVTASKIQANTITASQIAGSTITASQIAGGTITASQIASGTITGTQIAGTTITASHIASNTITASQIASGTITATQIAAGTIVAANIVAGTITANEIIGGAVSAMDGGTTPGDGASCSITGGGGKVCIVAYAEIGTLTGSAAGIVLTIYSNGSPIATGAIYCPGSWGGAGVAVPAFESSVTGSVTYSVGCTTTPGSGPYTINRTSVIATELHR